MLKFLRLSSKQTPIILYVEIDTNHSNRGIYNSLSIQSVALEHPVDVTGLCVNVHIKVAGGSGQSGNGLDVSGQSVAIGQR